MKLRLLALLTILLLALTACSNEDNTGGNGGSDMKLSDRVGTYECKTLKSSMDMIISSDGKVEIAEEEYTPQLDPDSTEIKFTVKNGRIKEYIIDFGNSTLTSTGSYENEIVYTISKK